MGGILSFVHSGSGGNAADAGCRSVAEQRLQQASPAREFDYTHADFERIRGLIYQKAGIALSAQKEDMVYSRLARRLRAYGLNRFSDYLGQLEAGGPEEWEVFVNALTTNLTSFFREAHHFEMLAAQMQQAGTGRPFRIWCSAASTGEEPYSIAITAVEAFGSWTPPVTILASDLDTNVLKHAEAGIYGAERIEKMEGERVRRFFLRGTGKQQGSVRVRPELQAFLKFQRINLLDGGWPVKGDLDAIFCRNVMIYFDKPTQYDILAKFKPLLRTQGLLYAGHSESFMHASDLFRPLGRTVYERADATQRR
jgi:chemotaxis protein methyltransferase CheR